jgi:hypothetical protein
MMKTHNSLINNFNLLIFEGKKGKGRLKRNPLIKKSCDGECTYLSEIIRLVNRLVYLSKRR